VANNEQGIIPGLPEQPGVVRTHRRQRLTITLHPQTVLNLEKLTDIYKIPYGRLIDALVSRAMMAVDQRTQYCVLGGKCPINKQDIPEVI